MEARHQHHVPPPLVGWLFTHCFHNGSAHGMGSIILTFIVKTARDFLGIGRIESAVA